MGVLIPLATLVAALVFGGLVEARLFTAVAIVTLAAGVAYVLATLALSTAIAEPRGRQMAPCPGTPSGYRRSLMPRIAG